MFLVLIRDYPFKVEAGLLYVIKQLIYLVFGLLGWPLVKFNRVKVGFKPESLASSGRRPVAGLLQA